MYIAKFLRTPFFLQNTSGGCFYIVLVIVWCNLGPSRPRQNCVGFFPSKSLLCTQGQYCAMLSQTYLDNFVLTRQYSSEMLTQHGWYNIAWVIFSWKLSVCHGPTLNRWFLFGQCWPRKILCGLCNHGRVKW